MSQDLQRAWPNSRMARCIVPYKNIVNIVITTFAPITSIHHASHTRATNAHPYIPFHFQIFFSIAEVLALQPASSSLHSFGCA